MSKKTLTKTDVVRGFAEEYNITLNTAKNLYDTLFNYLCKLIIENDSVNLAPLGSFKHKRTQGRPYHFYGTFGISPDREKIVWNPSTGLEIIQEVQFESLSQEEKEARIKKWKNDPRLAETINYVLENMYGE